MIANRLTVVPGVSFPFYPMRPRHGVLCKTPEAVQELLASAATYLFHRKLNGDRVCMAKLNGKLYWANRHGSWYSYGIENKHLFAELKDGTVLDGEVYRKKFYPFDCLVVGDDRGPVNVCALPVEKRVELTKHICLALGVPWLWDVDAGWLNKLEANYPQWEGVVCKRRGSKYTVLGSDGQESVDWRKNKWVI